MAGKVRKCESKRFYRETTSVGRSLGGPSNVVALDKAITKKGLFNLSRPN